jgi:AcrR family transcriptional regulator
MAQSRKPKRQYNSTRRQAQARENRWQVVEAARRLFTEYGYAGATIDAIAQEAGVAPETIFATFGNKQSILAALIDVAVGGDDQTIPLLQRSGPQTVLQEPDPDRLLQFFAADISVILERVAPVFAIMRVAAKTEPDIAELLKNLLEERLRNLATVAQRLSAQKALREDLNVAQAAEIIWTITSPEVFSLLTIDRGWAKDQYVRWLGDALARLLLP